MDGSGDKKSSKIRSNSPVSAIFVHAGAGYHSTANERFHLDACNDATRAGMKILKAGGSSVDAVEAAIKVLEDKEITNAGYGSNLTLEGVVECDATIVDHFGRSGACGATPKIKNPIHLARMILDASSQPLSLRRVPPNLLVGEGATDFAWEHGISVVPHDILVSKNARERFVRWREDLKRAATRLTPDTPSTQSSPDYDEMADLEYEQHTRNKQRRDHTAALLRATWNEGQSDSPVPQSPIPDIENAPETLPGLGADKSYSNSSPTTGGGLCSPTGPSVKRARRGGSRTSDGSLSHPPSLLSTNAHEKEDMNPPTTTQTVSGSRKFKKSRQSSGYDGNDYDSDMSFGTIDKPMSDDLRDALSPQVATKLDEDFITDTVGAIAIDSRGRIAAASSSGGIGMKHRGRVGPAALVGIGTAVIPPDIEDLEAITVAAVTSGTGEHMATTMASQKCAERLYHCTRKGLGGNSIAATEDEAMESFVKNDFMQHPGVLTSHSAGAIGVMAVKKTPTGYYLHFAHNTDSFALASMHSHEKDPKCVMSRITDQGSVVLGARKIRIG